MTIITPLMRSPPPQVERFRSPLPIERVAILPVRNYGPPPIPDPFPVRHRFAQVVLPKCKAGDVIEANFSMQVSNALSYQVEVAWSLRLTQSATGFEGVAIPGTSKATNVTWAQHHCPVSQFGRGRISSDGDWFLIAMVYAGGGSQTQPGDQIVADLAHGAFDVTRTRHSLELA